MNICGDSCYLPDQQADHLHLARHSFATEICLTKGVPIESVSKMLGHTNIQTTQIYARVVDRKLSHDMNMLDRKLKSMQKGTTQNAV